MTIAIFGANGQLGHALQRAARERLITVTAFDRATADVTDRNAVREAAAKAGATLIINAAAYTAVDKAESEPDRAMAVNRDGVRNLASLGLPMIHVSTDYVFDGTKKGAWVETDATAPLGAYGRSKLEGEKAAANGMIVRTAWVHGLEGANFVKTMLRLGRERDVLRVVNDQRGCPTFADDLAHGLLTMAEKYRPGLYHLAGTGTASWYEFACEIFGAATRPRVEPITTAEYPTPARRPANSVLDCTRAKADFGIELPHWKDGLRRMLEGLA
jgi:dTDP-4-dehydrorhamnose reductase